ncbi:MAG: tetratricopeptide repeat protein [Bacteroidaceae bacterium]|jgi:tetratricopeptide (TPR) repeat protein
MKHLLTLLCALLLLSHGVYAQDEKQARFDYFYLEAVRLQAANRLTDAFEMFRYCERLDSTSADVQYALAPFYISLRMDSIGFACLEKACRLAPDNYWYASQLAGLYVSKGRYPEAIARYEAMRRKYPQREEPIYQLLDLYPRTGEFEQAVALLDSLEQKSGKNEEISLRKSQLFLYQHKPEEAYREVASLIVAYPDEPRYRCLLGDLYLSQDQYPEALAEYQAALKQDPSSEMTRTSLATYYETVGDSANYIRTIEGLLLDSLTSSDTKGQIMAHLIREAPDSPIDSTRTLQLFDRIMEQETEDNNLMMLYAQYLLAHDMREKAAPVLRELLARDPSNTLVRQQLLIAAISKQDAETIINLCIPVTREAPQTPDDLAFHYYLTAAYYQEDRYEDALATAQNALAHLPQGVNDALISDFWAVSGDLFHLLKRENEAFAAYDSSLAYNPRNIGSLNNYAYYISLQPQGDLQKAERMSKITIEEEPYNSTYLDTYAWILHRLGKAEEARTYIDRCLALDKEQSAELLDHAGDIYFALGLKAEAIDFWQKALKAGIENPKEVEQKIKKAQ